MEHLTNTFHVLLGSFRVIFTEPSYQIFLTLMTGWVVSVRHRYVTELIYGGDKVGQGHWSRYHRFFSHYVWSLDDFCLVLARLLIKAFVGDGFIFLAVDDTLCRKRGLNLFGAGMHHDPLLSSKALKLVSWGHDWVILSLIVACPSWAPTKVFALPIGFRLYRNLQENAKAKKANDTASRASTSSKKSPKKKSAPKKSKSRKMPVRRADGSLHETRPQLALQLIHWFAVAFPERTIVIAGDSLYGGKSVLAQLPANTHLISRVHPGGALYEPAPEPVPGRRGPKPKKGKRLPSMNEWANDSTPWTDLEFDQYGLHAKLSVKTRQGLYYKAGRARLLTFVLMRDNSGKRPLAIFYATLLDWTARDILTAYARRWAIEVSFENGKQLLGFEDPANRLPKAVQRTAPMAMILVSLITLWFHQEGHRHVVFPDRPWYRRKKEPSFGDMLTTLRRLSWTEFLGTPLNDPTLAKTRLAKITEFLSRAG
jgi:DDE superfamily endonuclease